MYSGSTYLHSIPSISNLGLKHKSQKPPPTYLFRRNEHLHHEVLHALGSKRRKWCAASGDGADQLLPRASLKEVEGQEFVHQHFRSHERADPDMGAKHRRKRANWEVKNGRRA